MDRPYDRREVNQEAVIHLAGSGYFRHVWFMERPSQQQAVVLKEWQLTKDFPINEHAIFQVQKESIILERLSTSDRIIDTYGHCGIRYLAEAANGDIVDELVPPSGYMAQADLDQSQVDGALSMNSMTLSAKIKMALVMAQSIADIHGYVGGVIAHGDVHPEQWLRTLDSKIKPNDLNLAEIIPWDPWNETHCDMYPCFSCSFHAPEELNCRSGSEAFDTYSFGNNLYVLLTGLWP
jgi:hypothetical protein